MAKIEGSGTTPNLRSSIHVVGGYGIGEPCGNKKSGRRVDHAAELKIIVRTGKIIEKYLRAVVRSKGQRRAL